MGNILRALKRDILRLLKAPAALVVVGALLILPSAYTWYNVVAFWNPYDNTGNMRVAVVNLDEGASSSLTGDIAVGDSIVETLQDNTQLKWVFDDYDTAMSDLKSGKDYAVFVIPASFSSDMISMITGEVHQPKLEYYVNEKAGPVSPKVTDTGANTLEETINSTFVSTVTDAIAKTLGDKVVETQEAVSEAKSKAERQVDKVAESLAEARASMAELSSSADQARADIVVAKESLAASRDDVARISEGLAEASATSKELQDILSTDVAASLEAVNKALTDLTLIEDYLKTQGYGEEAAEALAAIKAASSDFSTTVLEESIAAMADLSTTTANLSATVANQQMIIDQADSLLDQMDGTLVTVKKAADQSDKMLADLQSDLSSIRTDIVALARSTALDTLMVKYNLSPESIASFMGSPTKLTTEHLYELNAYGGAMAPLFMCLTFWIGAFCLLIIMKQEVDDKGIEDMTFTQRYLVRFILFAGLVVVQSAICVTGVLFIGVEVASVAGLYLAAAAASLAFLSIIYAFSVLFQHIGKGICIILVFLQIPAATGLYPIEMTSAFYQAISPLFPFTYGIAAIRECICGFYGTEYVFALGSLAVYFVLFLVLGIALRPVMAGTNLMVAKQVRESGLFNGEDVEVPHHTYKLSEIMAILADKADYQDRLRYRHRKFLRVYPRLIKASAILGVCVPVLLLFLHSFTYLGKVNLLTAWLIWLVPWFVSMVVVENLRFRFEKQLDSLAEGEEESHA